MHKIKIFMVDDHEYILSITEKFLTLKGMDFIGGCTTFKDALENSLKNNPDIVIVDLNLVDGSGIDLIKELRALDHENKVKILMFSARTLGSLPAIAAAYRSGANGYITKNADPEELVNAIKHIYDGNDYYMPSYAEKILSYIREGKDPDPRSILSKGEFNIFYEISKEKTIDQVAEKLSLNPNTVRNRITDIRKKLGSAHEDFSIIANRHGISFIRD